MAARSRFGWWLHGGRCLGIAVLAAHRALVFEVGSLPRAGLLALLVVAWSWVVLFAGDVPEPRFDSGTRQPERLTLRATLQAAPSRCESGTCRLPDQALGESADSQRGRWRERRRLGGWFLRAREPRHGDLSTPTIESGGVLRRLRSALRSHFEASSRCDLRSHEEEQI